ncbi:hypothetical protein SOVF_191610 [Spinacia oleracea]|uniref:Uncharacterized protein isoform X1 n=1 Tax=Spinacia oleracea TaxID=3562 RepID=A0ABM3RU31_SPIOL|nr:uncharacterized protein LOC110790166 isoform X1 [Spinacia oleracea]KNA05242.1 hypothetical protein SOVF_191610 [Spinacia oleracea]
MSHRYSYRKDDILSLGLDVTGVCVYCINSTDVFLPKSVSDKYHHLKGYLGCCRSCGKPVKKSAFYCSILCKLLANEEQENFGIAEMIMEHENPSRRRCLSKNRKREREEEKKIISLSNNGGGFSVEMKHGGNPVILKNAKEKLETLIDAVNLTYRKKGRKGIPYRAHFF